MVEAFLVTCFSSFAIIALVVILEIIWISIQNTKGE